MFDLLVQYPVEFATVTYVSVVSLVAIILTVFDKKIAGTNKRRVPEATLLLWSALGGSAAMLLTMILIRHKTLHNKFMIGIPLIMLLQALAIFGLFYFGILS